MDARQPERGQYQDQQGKSVDQRQHAEGAEGGRRHRPQGATDKARARRRQGRARLPAARNRAPVPAASCHRGASPCPAKTGQPARWSAWNAGHCATPRGSRGENGPARCRRVCLPTVAPRPAVPPTLPGRRRSARATGRRRSARRLPPGRPAAVSPSPPPRKRRARPPGCAARRTPRRASVQRTGGLVPGSPQRFPQRRQGLGGGAGRQGLARADQRAEQGRHTVAHGRGAPHQLIGFGLAQGQQVVDP